MPGKTTSQKEKATNDYHPYGMPWLDSCYQETFLPSGPWHKVYDKICDALAVRIGKQFNHPERKQMIFELMGIDFVQKYFPEEPYNPLIIEPPLMSGESRTKLQLDAQNWLQNALSKVCAETGSVRPINPEESESQMSEETKEFLRHTRFIFSKGMNRHLHLQEKEIEEKWSKSQWEKEKIQEKSREARERQLERERLQREHDRLYGGPSNMGLRSILKNTNDRKTPGTRLTTAASVDSDRGKTANVKGALFGTNVDPPAFSGMQSNSLGRSLMAILKRDPRRFAEVAAKLHGRQLPAGLRTYIWMDILLKHEREKLNDVHVETLVRERFGRSVARGVSELRIKRATHSPIGGLIENAVIEMYDKTPAMRQYIEDSLYMKESAKALNVLYVYDRSYEPYLIHWLFPLQLCFQDASGQDEHVYELAMYLDLLNKGLFPKWPEIFASAEKVMSRLKGADLELHDHLKYISGQNANINPKDFLVQLIHQEKSEAEMLLKLTPGSDRSVAMNKQLLADPLIFLRKWIGEGFVGVLDTQAAVFIWDQCFLQKWHLQVIEDACLALLLLLKHRFMYARDYIEMKEVFLKGPSLVYTLDIQRAWLHIQNQGDYPEVPYMNRLRPKTPEKASPIHRSPTPSISSTAPLEPLGIKKLKMTLFIPAESVEREKWLANLDMRRLQLECNIFFGSIKIADQKTKHTPVIVDGIDKDRYGALTYRIEYPRDRLLFDSIDVGKYDLEMEMGGVPFAVIEIKYKVEGVSQEIPLGWTRVKLYQHKSELPDRQFPEGQHWLLMGGDYFYPIYAGPTLDKFANDPTKTPKPTGPELLGNNCQLGAFIYNPRGDEIPPSPAPSTPAKKTPTPTPRPAPKRRTPSPPTPPRKTPSSSGTESSSSEASSPTRTTSTPTDRSSPSPTSKSPTPSPSPTPTPSPKKTPPPKDLGLKDPFNLFIDAVSNVPDNSTIIKVTGRLVKTGKVKDIKDLMAVPEINSPARNPRFKYQFPQDILADMQIIYHLAIWEDEWKLSIFCGMQNNWVNQEKEEFDEQLVLLLRIYTVDVDTRELVVVGSSLFEVFDENQNVKLGNHVRQVHSGMPDLKKGLGGIHHKALDDAPRIPGCRLYIRITSHGNKYIEPPPLDDYQIHEPGFNESEKIVVKSFNKDKRYPSTVKEAIRKLRQAEEDPEPNTDPILWLIDRLNNKKHLPPNQPAENLDIHRLVRYRLDVGFSINIVRAYGLPDGYYIQCFARVVPGKSVLDMPTTSEGYGKDEKLITLKHDWDSTQRAPVWNDTISEWHPHIDDNSCIIVQLFGLDPVYKPNSNHATPGKVKRKDGQPLTLGDDDLLGWAVVPLFEKDYVLNGRHHVPIFKNKPEQEILDALTQELPEEVIGRQTWDNSNKYDGAALVVDIWDSHYKREQIPGGLVRTDFLLDVLEKKDLYLKAENDRTGKKLSDLVMKQLDKKDQKPNSEVFKKELVHFETVLSKTYYELMESALMNAGYGPL